MKGVTDSEPEETKAKKREDSTDEKDEPRGEFVAGKARKETNILTNIIGDTKKGKLALVETQNRFQRVGVKWECVSIP